MSNSKFKMLQNFSITAVLVSSLLAPSLVNAAGISVGAAPKGEAKAVSAKIIKNNFPACKKVFGAARRPDGSISAQCNDINYLVFTVLNPKEGRTMELALNCTAAKKHLAIAC